MKLLFVYNAKAGMVHRLIDFTHKIVSPATYECDLCHLTHGGLGERPEWKRFSQMSGTEFRFFHIDEFEREFGTKYFYPVVLKEEGKKLSVLLNHKDLGYIENVEEFISLLENRGVS